MKTQSSALTNQDADQFKLRVQLHVTGVEPVQPRLITDSQQQAGHSGGNMQCNIGGRSSRQTCNLSDISEG